MKTLLLMFVLTSPTGAIEGNIQTVAEMPESQCPFASVQLTNQLNKRLLQKGKRGTFFCEESDPATPQPGVAKMSMYRVYGPEDTLEYFTATTYSEWWCNVTGILLAERFNWFSNSDSFKYSCTEY